jgi:hypothetical protein
VRFERSRTVPTIGKDFVRVSCRTMYPNENEPLDHRIIRSCNLAMPRVSHSTKSLSEEYHAVKPVESLPRIVFYLLVPLLSSLRRLGHCISTLVSPTSIH